MSWYNRESNSRYNRYYALADSDPTPPGPASPAAASWVEGEPQSDAYDLEPVVMSDSVGEALSEHDAVPKRRLRRTRERVARTVFFTPGAPPPAGARASNAINNQKYTLLTFIPLSLWEQFHAVYNVFFLLLALAQIVPEWRVGYAFTYLAPLALVLGINMLKELYDDLNRRRRDRELNTEPVLRLARVPLVRAPDTAADAPPTRRELKAVASGVAAEWRWTSVPASDLVVGDVIRLTGGQRVPADTLVLRTSDAGGTVFVKTDQLDGECDWKVRRAPAPTQALGTDMELVSEATSGWQVFAEAPTREIYSFVGQLTCNDETVGLAVENMLWSSCAVAAGAVTGLVLYTGADTRQALYQTKPTMKQGDFDQEMNVLVKFMFLVVFLTAFMFTAGGGFAGNWSSTLVRFIVLFSNVIPNSLSVNLVLARALYMVFLAHDRRLPGANLRSSSLPEQLGRVQNLFSDKTGTLTCNEMRFRVLHTGARAYHAGADDAVASHAIGAAAHEDSDTPSTHQKLVWAVHVLALCHSVSPIDASADTEHQTNNNTEAGAGAGDKAARRRARAERAITQFAWDAHERKHATLAGLPAPAPGAAAEDDHTSAGAGTGLRYQASSPDEIALVEHAAQLGLRLSRRTDVSMTLEVPAAGVDACDEIWDILEEFPFASALQRMSIVVRSRANNRIYVLVKGSDTAIPPLCKGATDWIGEETLALARDGLRTLVFASRELSPAQWADLARGLASARSAITDRPARVAAARADIECDLTPVCVSGVEDRLQPYVPEVLESLRQAHVRVWMLTGDKPDTAMCVGRAAQLIGRDQTYYRCMASDYIPGDGDSVSSVSSSPLSDEPHAHALGPAAPLLSRRATVAGVTPEQQVYVEHRLKAFIQQATSAQALIVDGATLAFILSDFRKWHPRGLRRAWEKVLGFWGWRKSGKGVLGGGTAELFVQAALAAPAVICSRCTPEQKALVARYVRLYTNEPTAGCGDGGNDVALIREADIGIGLEGKEGRQAALAADVSVREFSHIRDLIFWHGRNAYKNSAALTQFVLHRGLILSVMQCIYSALFYFSAVSLFSSVLLLGYATVFTMLPVFSMTLDADVWRSEALAYPELYAEVGETRLLGGSCFAGWALTALWQAGVIFSVSMWLFESNFYLICAVLFSSLIIIEFANLAATISTWHWAMVVSIVVSLLMYFGTLFLMPGFFDPQFLLSFTFVWKTLTAAAAGWLPSELARQVTGKIHTPIYKKIRALRKDKH